MNLNCDLCFQSIFRVSTAGKHFAKDPFRKEQFAKVKEKTAEMCCKRKVCGEKGLSKLSPKESASKNLLVSVKNAGI